MNVPHDLLIALIRKDKIVDRVCEALGISVFDESGDIIIERIHTLQTVYELHEKNGQAKVLAVHEGTDTPLVSSSPLS